MPDDTLTPKMIEGIPEGLRAVRWGMPDKDEFILIGNCAQPGSRHFGPALIVEADEGYDLAYDIANNAYNLQRKLDRPIILTATFKATNMADYARLKEILPRGIGFVSLTEDGE